LVLQILYRYQIIDIAPNIMHLHFVVQKSEKQTEAMFLKKAGLRESAGRHFQWELTKTEVKRLT